MRKEMTVLLPTPAELRRALARYADAAIDDERHSTPENARAREDHAYTLCIMTGTTNIFEAMRAADAIVEGTATGLPAVTSRVGPALSPAQQQDDVTEAA
ncbi:DUF5133 domain-containing protein [Streptomyces sp. NPDC059900]|uniref:DUF5133 domain-containing protein n=1 Tax=Streptomyces sp. NPDC059900 TaxID=3155816 RepID=UPI003434F153